MYKYIQFQSTANLDISLALRFEENKKPVTTGVSTNNKNFTTMAIAKTAATKGRETKLGKKTYEELIQIILKKDKIENRLNVQLNSLKTENKALQNRVNSFDKDQEGNVKAIGDLKDRNKALNEVIMNNKVQIEELNQEINTYSLIAAEARDKVKALKAVVCLLGAIAFVLALILIF